MRKDLLISLLGHLTLIVILIVLSPSTGLLRGKPEVMTVSLDFTPPGRSGAGEGGQPAVSTQPPLEQEVPLPRKEVPPSKKEKAAQTEATKEKSKSDSKSDGKGGLDVSSRVGSGTGEGENIGGSNLPYNLGLVLSIIERAWRNPVTSPTMISCTIYCQIDRSGTLIGEPVVEKSSGVGVFDQGAVFAVKRAGQFPPFPMDFEYDYIGLHLDFEYAP